MSKTVVFRVASAMVVVGLLGSALSWVSAGSGAGRVQPGVSVVLHPGVTNASLVSVAANEAAELQGAGGGAVGSVTGTVTFDGTAPALKPLVKKGDASAKDAAVCAAEEVPDESVVVNAKGSGLKNVFIYLSKAPAGVTVPAAPKTPVVFDQKNCRFLPHALTVRATQPIKVLSDDPITHNTHTFPVRNTGFNQAIKPSDRTGIELVYAQPERLPVEVKCDLHPWMKAYHLVLDHPYMAVTDENGKFEIGGLPPGEHTFTLWHEKTGYLDRMYKVTVSAGKATDVKLKYGAAKFAQFNGPQPKSVVVAAGQ